MNANPSLLRRIRLLTALFIFGLVISGATAIPLAWELDLLVRVFGINPDSPTPPVGAVAEWLLKVRGAIHEVSVHHPFLFYGTDWLAFGHFVIAIAFIGAWRDPARNIWLFEFGLIACVLVVPYALVFGALRGIPFGWRLIDCAFGVVGFVPLWFAWRWTKQLSADSRE